MGSFRDFISKIAPALPFVGGVASNVLAGINERKARLYNSPANQIARMRDAGLPLAAGSNITAGGGVSTRVADLGLGQINDNLGKSIIRDIDRKKLQIMQQELRAAKSAADLAEGNVRNQLNPAGMFEATNQGTGVAQTLAQQAEAVKTAETVNKYMPMEKALGIMKSGKDIEIISSQIKNNLIQHQIFLKDYEIKKILANYQERMSNEQLTAMIRDNTMRELRNTGLGYQNNLNRVSSEIALATQGYQIKLAENAARNSDQSVLANKLAYTRDLISMPSFRAYYQIREGLDQGVLAKQNLPNTLLYLGMMSPQQSTYNFNQLIPSIPSPGNTYNTNNYIPNK